MRVSRLAAALGVAATVLLCGATGASAATLPSVVSHAVHDRGHGHNDDRGGRWDHHRGNHRHDGRWGHHRRDHRHDGRWGHHRRDHRHDGRWGHHRWDRWGHNHR
ncbi:hypothetical protein [Streptomyces sp. NPDC059176]|uniref:hypothetical protein n=1 Tax=unclassified Streptomyces TaxID=2593676 RepID=UPI0036819126